MKIAIDIEVVVEAIIDLIKIDKISSKKACVGYSGRYSVRDSDMLTIACLSSHANAMLLSYLDEQDIEEITRLVKSRLENLS